MSDKVRIGIVKHFRAFGTLIEISGESFLVHAFEQSWFWPYDARRHLRINDKIPVWVGQLGPKRQICASFRRAHMEYNPVKRFQVGDTVSGTISAVDHDSISVNFGPGQEADFSTKALQGSGVDLKNLRTDDAFFATIESITEGPIILLRPKPPATLTE